MLAAGGRCLMAVRCACAAVLLSLMAVQEYEALYADVDRCDLGHFTKFVNPDLKFCGPPGTGQDKTATLLIQNFQVSA